MQLSHILEHVVVMYYLANVSRKLHQNEEILGQRMCPLHPIDPPLSELINLLSAFWRMWEGNIFTGVCLQGLVQ